MKNRLALTGQSCLLGVVMALAIVFTAVGEVSPTQQYKALVKEFKDASQKFSKADSAAKTNAERQEAQKLAPSRRATAQRMLALAGQHPKSSAALDALVWVLSESFGHEETVKAGDQLLRDYLDSHKLWEVCNKLTHALPNEIDQPSKVLHAILEKSQNRKTQGWAAYCLGRRLILPWWQTLKLVDHDRTPEAEALFNLVVQSYADVEGWPGRTLGEIAKGELFELHHLAIGKVAPEIEGQDVDGKRFKLSDYRGKVVVIDFWGDW